MNLLDYPVENGSFSLFVGESGSGKTAAIASYGKLGKVLIMDFDKRFRGALGVRSVLGDDCLRNVEIKQYNILGSFSQVDAELSQLQQASMVGKCPYKTIVLESVNTLETCFMNMVDGIAQAQKGTGIATKQIGGIRVYSPAHYKFAATAFRQLRDYRLMEFKDVHVILSCWTVNKWDKPHELNDKGEKVIKQYADNVVVGKKLLLTDKMAEEVPGCFDEVYEFYREESNLASQPVKHGVRFVSSIAKTMHEPLKKAVYADLTNKSFIDEFQKLKVKG